MTAEAIYAWLMDGRAEQADPFDAHVAGCLLALAAAESRASGRVLTDCIGLDASGLAELVEQMFPAAAFLFTRTPMPVSIERGEDEICLVDLLRRFSTRRSPFQYLLAAIMARRAQQPNHLWQDLGLRSRDELSRLMQTHFTALAARNKNDMKWKKFFYRMICRDANYSLCTAPSCAECDDFAHCFGDESGESLLAHIRRDADRAI